MKATLILCAVLCFVFHKQNQVQATIYDDCVTELSVSQYKIAKMCPPESIEPIPTNDEDCKNFKICVLQKRGILNEAKHINYDYFARDIKGKMMRSIYSNGNINDLSLQYKVDDMVRNCEKERRKLEDYEIIEISNCILRRFLEERQNN